MRKIEILCEEFPDEEFIEFTGFDDAIIGVYGNDWNNKPAVVAYSQKEIIKILMKDMSYDDAMEHFGFNIIGGYLGEKTPIIIDDMHEFVFPEDESETVSFTIPDSGFKPSVTSKPILIDNFGLDLDIQKELNGE